ncbi:uncharacterized protein GGS25DRAFT_525655 [Hypoxylon fragiforme]|uniref:uncharacterized protein n=1 Tax=Hypoxylon fragiforme TaxID=63214 RepID=UPI0020C5B77D|nr:uncharacterized protein GGS25DRAFT_525655 [Hypoxylon fragiforme]KAI2604372.1 hypothetical protein GGS25DRAFT_525655 [Hypoxylon fragiforme]
MHPSASTHDYYAILGVGRRADAESIKAAWRHLARVKHPDKNPGNPKATAEFQLLQSAYSTLSNPERRRQYDELRFAYSFEKKKKQASSNSNTERSSSRRASSTPQPASSSPPHPSSGRAPKGPGSHALKARLERLRAMKAAHEAEITKARLRMSSMDWETNHGREDDVSDTESGVSTATASSTSSSGAGASAPRRRDHHRSHIDNRSWWEKLVATVVSGGQEEEDDEEDEDEHLDYDDSQRKAAASAAAADQQRRRVNWESARQHTKVEQSMRQWELIRSLEVDLSLITREIRNVVQQEAEEQEKAELAAAKQKAKLERQRRREQERRQGTTRAW